MNDRELLELAAKAAGIELRWHPDGTAYADQRCKDYWGVWNPLTDDGDALRLAVTIGMNLYIGKNRATAEIPPESENDKIIQSDGFNGCYKPYAATRRAIVRAAAELAK